MSAKAPRIPASVWDGYKEEITALYTAPHGTLEKVMDAMKERYGFQPTKSQYATKWKQWGLQKYANALDYTWADQKIKKRALEGKDTDFNIRGKKISRKDMEREIGRNTTLTSRLQYAKDIPTPEGIQVFTPCPDVEVSSTLANQLEYTEYILSPEGVQVSTPSADTVTLQEADINYLLWFRLQKDFPALIVQTSHNEFPPSTISNMLDPAGKQLDILRNPQFGVKLLQMAVGDALKLEDSKVFILIKDPKTRQRRRRYLSSYFPPSDAEVGLISSPFRSTDFGMPSQLAAMQRFLQYFVCLTNNDALEHSQTFNVVTWLLKKFNKSLFAYIFNLRTTTSKIFMRKILPASVNSGNTKLVEEILNRAFVSRTRHDNDLPLDAEYLQEYCITIAVQRQDQRMLQLLCEAGFPPQFYLDNSNPLSQKHLPLDTDIFLSQGHLPWNTASLDILQTLISFGADPDGMLVNVERGFPLINAAELGNLAAVDMLLKAGSRVNSYVRDYFGTPLQAAVYANQAKMVEFLIAKGADVNAPFGEQYRPKSWRWSDAYRLNNKVRDRHQCIAKTPIQIACEMNNMSLVELLLANGALVDLSPLSRITAEGVSYVESAMSYITNFESSSGYSDDYSPNYKTILYYTAFQHSVQHRNIFLLYRLLSQGANPDSRIIPNWGDTPLQMAARLNYPEIVSILMENGANVNAPPGRVNGRTALQAAAESGNIEMVQLLLFSNADVNAPAGYERGLTALQAAIKNGHFDVAELLLKSNADIHAPPSPRYGLSAIAAAASGKNLSMLEFLTKNGSGGRESVPAICAAAEYSWVEGARYLLQHGSDVNSVCDDYISPLAWSITKQNLAMMKFLLESGANLKLPMKEELCVYNDALCFAIEQRCPREIIFFLCHHYAKLGPSHLHEEALALAVAYIHDKQDGTVILRSIQDIMSGLSEASYSKQVARAWRALSNNIYAVSGERIDEDQMQLKFKILLEMGADVNMYEDGPTALQSAIHAGQIGLAKYLLDEGAEIQVPAVEFTGTPLQEAIAIEELELAYTLLERGADVNASAAPNGGLTALQTAAETGNINIAVELLRRGAHVVVATAPQYGRTAITAAACYGREDMLQLLLDHYDGRSRDFLSICQGAAVWAEATGHPEIAAWLREYRVSSQYAKPSILRSPVWLASANVSATFISVDIH
uniref:Putative ankyrin repeat protein n=1 Tax=Talaromyces marneffei PM1 TaxID=1077442 RepID=A0A093V663_TALMA